MRPRRLHSAAARLAVRVMETRCRSRSCLSVKTRFELTFQGALLVWDTDVCTATALEYKRLSVI